MREEDTILRKVGTKNSFKVPEGYFENFTSEVMDKLPEKEKSTFETNEPTRWQKAKPWVYMAAMFVGAALIIRVASSGNGSVKNEREIAAADTAVVSDQYINAALDGSMMDDYSLYVYLSDSGEE